MDAVKRDAVERAARAEFESMKCSVPDMDHLGWDRMPDLDQPLPTPECRDYYRGVVRTGVEALARAGMLVAAPADRPTIEATWKELQEAKTEIAERVTGRTEAELERDGEPLVCDDEFATLAPGVSADEVTQACYEITGGLVEAGARGGQVTVPYLDRDEVRTTFPFLCACVNEGLLTGLRHAAAVR